MLCFDVRLNGERVALAGVDDGVLSAILSCVSKPPDGPELNLEIGGLHDDTHQHWAEPSVKMGDRIEVRIVEADNPDQPVSTSRNDKVLQEQSERRYFEMLRQKYGW